MSRDATIPPPPTASETFGNLHVARVAQVDGRRNRAKKAQEQFNTKVAPGFGDKVDDVRRELEGALKRDIPRGELLEMMLAAFVASREGKDLGAALTALKAPAPTAEDRAAQRGHAVTFFATREVKEGLAEMARTRGWSLGAVIEDTMAKAARLVALEGRGGKGR